MANTGPIKNVIVLGATGSVGPAVVDALLSSKFNVSVYTRSESKKQPPSSVTVYKGDYDESSLYQALEGKDAVVSAVSTFSTPQQKSIIDVAIRAGVRRFIPSEFGMDTANPDLGRYIPGILDFKQDIVKYLKTKEDKLSWSAIIVGAFLDWSLQIPGLLGLDVPGRKANIFDDGNTKFEVTNLALIGKAVAATLEHFDETANEYVYINSFTVTQKQLVAELEKAIGDKFTLTHVDSKSFATDAIKKVKDSMQNDDYVEIAGSSYINGAVELIQFVLVTNYGGLNAYSEKGLWNARLGLPGEDLSATVDMIVKNH